MKHLIFCLLILATTTGHSQLPDLIHKVEANLTSVAEDAGGILLYDHVADSLLVIPKGPKAGYLNMDGPALIDSLVYLTIEPAEDDYRENYTLLIQVYPDTLESTPAAISRFRTVEKNGQYGTNTTILIPYAIRPDQFFRVVVSGRRFYESSVIFEKQ